MAQASRKHTGAGAQGKGSGAGAMTDAPPDLVPENKVLSNRDKQSRTKDRGQDTKTVQTDQLQEHSHNRAPDDAGKS